MFILEPLKYINNFSLTFSIENDGMLMISSELFVSPGFYSPPIIELRSLTQDEFYNFAFRNFSNLLNIFCLL